MLKVSTLDFIQNKGRLLRKTKTSEKIYSCFKCMSLEKFASRCFMRNGSQISVKIQAHVQLFLATSRATFAEVESSSTFATLRATNYIVRRS